MRTALILAPLLLLAACGESNNPVEPGTTVKIDARDEKGEAVAIVADGESGDVAVKLPGFEAKVDLPRINLTADNFDIEGVKLYPGTKIDTININSDENGTTDSTKVLAAFTAPATPDQVAAHLRAGFADKKIDVSGSGTSMSGVTSDGAAFTISISPAKGGSAGRIEIATR